jgi:hypothetical protein
VRSNLNGPKRITEVLPPAQKSAMEIPRKRNDFPETHALRRFYHHGVLQRRESHNDPRTRFHDGGSRAALQLGNGECRCRPGLEQYHDRTLSGQNPFAQARYAAITQLAVFEAVNAITGQYRPYLGTISAPPGSSVEAAAAAAAYTVLKNYFPAAAPTSTPHWPTRLPRSETGQQS